jgi:hypothetical protein
MLAAGCDGYISKPIDTRTFAKEVIAHMERHNGESHPLEDSTAADLALLAHVAVLRGEFLTGARREARALLELPDTGLGDEATLIALHRWVGIGGSIGLVELSTLAREAEDRAAQPPSIRGPLIRPLMVSILALLESVD